MAFFNKIGEKITSGANAVSDSAKKAAETSRLNSKINADIAEVNNKYNEIGKAVKLRLMDSITDPEVVKLASEIDALLVEVKELGEQVKAIKGIKNCPNCGASLNADVMFCPNCGTRQGQPAQAAPVQPTVEPIPAPIPEPVQPAAEPISAPILEPVQPAAEPIPAPIPEPVEESVEEINISEPSQEVEAEINVGEAIAEEEEAAQPVISEPVVKPFTVPAAAPIPEPSVSRSAEKMPEPEVKPAAAPIPEPVKQTAPKFIFCTECGNREEAGTKFCSECGNKLI